jgi:pimeloyl-ACP methyl ester carboxylesterase
LSVPILLLHGQPGAARDWDRVVAALGADARTIATDRPGWDGRRDAGGLAANAQDGVRALDAREIDRAAIVGHSFGGAVAAWIGATYPERVQSLVLVAPSANAASLYALDRWLATPVAGYAAGATILGGVGLALGVGRMRTLASQVSGLESAYLRKTGALLREPSSWRSFFVEQQTLVKDLPELEARLDRIVAPTTIVVGSSDHVVPASSARSLAGQIRGSELVMMESAGHLLPMQQAPLLAEIIERAAGT